MKTLFYSLISVCALSLAATAQAQNTGMYSSQGAYGERLLSERTEGDYIVRRYLIKGTQPRQADFTVQYAVSKAQVSGQFDENSAELRAIGDFIERMRRDSMIDVRNIAIIGYSSPDGTAAYNQRLARSRAEDLRTWLNTRYGLSNSYSVSAEGVVEPWSACADNVRGSSLQNKSTILDIIDSADPAPTVERRLKAHPTAWSWLRTEVLPSLRRTVVRFNFTEDRIDERRELIPRPQPEPEVEIIETVTRPCCCEESMDESFGVIVVMDAALID